MTWARGERTNLLEVSVANAPRVLLRELKRVFPGIALKSATALLTCQHAAQDLVGIGDEIEEEKDRLLGVFHEFASHVCDKLAEQGFWADFIDPCSGLPMRHDNSCNVYSEVDGMEVMLRYRTQSCGPCKILYHPRWSSSVYPASIFTSAPADVVGKLLRPLAPTRL